MVHLTEFQVFRSVWRILFFTFLATAKTKSNPLYTSCHACLTYHEICQQSNPIRSAWCYIYSIHFWQMTFDSCGSSYCILWLLCVFDPPIVLCRMMCGKWKFIPQLVYFHFTITLSSILAWYKFSQCCGIFVQLQCLALFILSVW